MKRWVWSYLSCSRHFHWVFWSRLLHCVLYIIWQIDINCSRCPKLVVETKEIALVSWYSPCLMNCELILPCVHRWRWANYLQNFCRLPTHGQPSFLYSAELQPPLRSSDLWLSWTNMMMMYNCSDLLELVHFVWFKELLSQSCSGFCRLVDICNLFPTNLKFHGRNCILNMPILKVKYRSYLLILIRIYRQVYKKHFWGSCLL